MSERSVTPVIGPVCPYCLDQLVRGPDRWCCGMQEDDFHREAQVAREDYRDRYGDYPDLSQFC